MQGEAGVTMKINQQPVTSKVYECTCLNRLLGIVAIVSLLCVGCYSLPRQRGTWDGEGVSIVLYDAEQHGCECAALRISDGPALKVFVPQRVVLVNSRLKTFFTNEYVGKKLRVTGLIMNDIPTCSTSGKELLGYQTNFLDQIGAIYLLKVSKIESH